MDSASPWRRHFFAFAPGDDARFALANLSLPAGARRVAAPDLHATLAFLDTLDVEGERRAAFTAKQVAERAGDRMTVSLALFERWSSSWVVCDDGRDDNVDLERLARALHAALREAGFAIEGRPFRAHVTVARQRGDAVRPMPARLAAPIRFAATELLLMASPAVVPAESPRYVLRARLPLRL